MKTQRGFFILHIMAIIYFIIIPAYFRDTDSEK
ncbi:hypothetical protein X965_14735 [Morganella sp. EGD-HP17]|nr:hypothetical protein X965_14735 [Morganella sp. EGD-HP17]